MDESALSEECLDEPPLPPPPSYPGPSALPLSGGMVSVPPDPSHLVAFAPSGAPVTHFNLDQLLDIVQSFRLDTTHAQECKHPFKKVGSLLRERA